MIARARLAAVCTIAASILFSAGNPVAQEQYDRPTLIPAAAMAAIANEVSGSQALNNVIDIAGYERNRKPGEYGDGVPREAEVVAAIARESGLAKVEILKPAGDPRPQWDGEEGEVWIEEPASSRRVLTRYRDVAATLAANSLSTDVTAELVFVGRGDRENDYAGKDVRGKIVLGWGGLSSVHRTAVVQHGAAGALSYGVSSGKPIDRPDQIAWGGIGAFPADGEKTGISRAAWWGFNLSHRMGMQLIDLLDRGPVRLSVRVRASQYPAQLPLVTATIPGDGGAGAGSKDEVVFVAHLFEGAAKQGANDNTSGVAVQLEIARAWIALVRKGALPAPKRTVRFLWVPEISGSMAYLREHPDEAKRMLAAINMDMVGANQTLHRNSANLAYTPFSLPSFVNDIGAQFTEWVGDTNREKVHNRRIAYAFQNPMIDPRGSQDPFRFAVDKFYGATDNQPFVDHNPRIPCISFDNWPDIAYHTSEDAPSVLDATQMKRMAFIGLSIAHVLATSTANDAPAVAALSVAFGQRRIGDYLSGGMMRLAEASTADALLSAYREALNIVRWTYWRETAQVESAGAFTEGNPAMAERVRAMAAAMAAGETVDRKRVEAAYIARAAALAVKPVLTLTLSPDEEVASRLIPLTKPQDGSSRGGGFGGGRPAAAGTPPSLTGYYASEARALADGSRSILDIHGAVGAEFGPVPLERVVSFFRAAEKAGAVTISERPLKK
jgi:Zn-dependent M28 family amino/carboxypeptidase